MPGHIVKNFASIATTKPRRDALAVLEAGLRAIDTKSAITASVKRTGSRLTIGDRSWVLDTFDHVYVIGIGKAAADAGEALERVLGSRITDGVILDVKPAKLKRLKSLVGSHPFPSLPNMRATGEIIGILKQVQSRDLVIAVVSGGGSALLCWPYQIKCDTLSTLTAALMARGATIHELNTIRKHLSEIQGGQFARLAYPAEVIGLIFSDVPGNDLDVIASGPTVMDLTTVADAKKIMKRYDVLKACQLPYCELRETPKDPLYFQNVTNTLLVSNAHALAAMRTEASKRGYRVRVYSDALQGEARDVGAMLAGLPRKGEIVLAGGETTVTVRGEGKGGRNQEVALGALEVLPEGGLVLSCASDGIDNSPAAGAIADERVLERARVRRLDSAKALATNNSYPFFTKTGSQILTGITGENVSDLLIALRT